MKSPKNKGVIILAHGWDSDKQGMLNYSKFFYKNGYNSLLLDLRGNGESEGDYTSLGYYEANDVLGAIRFVKSRNDLKNNKIGALGLSMGGAAIIKTAEDNNELSAIAVDSTYPNINQNAARRFKKVYGFPKFPFATSITFFGGLILGVNGFGLAPEKYVSNVHSPIMIIQGTQDDQVTIEDANQIYRNANEPKFLLLVENGKHANSYTANPNLYEKSAIEFFDKYLNTRSS